MWLWPVEPAAESNHSRNAFLRCDGPRFRSCHPIQMERKLGLESGSAGTKYPTGRLAGLPNNFNTRLRAYRGIGSHHKSRMEQAGADDRRQR